MSVLFVGVPVLFVGVPGPDAGRPQRPPAMMRGAADPLSGKCHVVCYPL